MNPYRKLFRRFGIELHRYYPSTNEFKRLAHYLHLHGVTVVLDVGANTGQFAEGLRDGGYDGRTVSFEPLSSAHSILKQKADEKWIVAPRVAIGDHCAKADIHISRNSMSSSILPMLDRHANAAPDSSYVGSEPVPLLPLDDAAKDFIGPSDTIFLKIDVQGFEAQVLAGAAGVLSRAVGLKLELSLVPLYEGSPTLEFLMQEVRGLDFELWDMEGGFRDPSSFRLLQFDGVFFRKTIA
jgi:FkbM family methyltransferase